MIASLGGGFKLRYEKQRAAILGEALQKGLADPEQQSVFCLRVPFVAGKGFCDPVAVSLQQLGEVDWIKAKDVLESFVEPPQNIAKVRGQTH